MATTPRPMAYRVEVGPKADAQLGELDPTVGSAVERKIGSGTV